MPAGGFQLNAAVEATRQPKTIPRASLSHGGHMPVGSWARCLSVELPSHLIRSREGIFLRRRSNLLQENSERQSHLRSSGNTTATTLATLVVLSLSAAAIYTALVATGYWETVYQVLLTAGAFYAFVIRRFEGTELFSPEEVEL